MKTELAAWNNGQGIDLESWIACVGSFSLAVGYLSIFCPEFVEFEGYILRKDFLKIRCAVLRRAVAEIENPLKQF